jgi:hypothetical protein
LCGDSCNVGQDDADHLAVSVALLARAAAAPETPSEGQVLSPTVLPHACVWMVVMAVMLDRMTRTASKIMIDLMLMAIKKCMFMIAILKILEGINIIKKCLCS